MSTVMVSILALYSYTQSTNNYNVILIGIPVAWAISDREDSDTIEVLFTVVKNKCPDAKVPTLMTDDGIFVCAATSNNLLLSMSTDLAGVIGCSRVYPEVQHLLCIWHVDRYNSYTSNDCIHCTHNRAWQRKLHSLVTCQQHRAEMYTCLRMLMKEQCKEKFMERQTTFISYWQSREPEFVAYYIQEYSKRIGKWLR